MVSTQSPYRSRVEIGGVYLNLPSQLEHNTTTLYVMVDIVKGGGVHPPHPNLAELIFPS